MQPADTRRAAFSRETGNVSYGINAKDGPAMGAEDIPYPP